MGDDLSADELQLGHVLGLESRVVVGYWLIAAVVLRVDLVVLPFWLLYLCEMRKVSDLPASQRKEGKSERGK